LPLRSERERVFYELSSSSVLKSLCWQNTRVGKLTHLAYCVFFYAVVRLVL
jgi:hypothetical protein